jgi:NitT/TauT family transport system substrate-binding protein
LARDLGYFDSASVHLVEYLSATDCLRAFGNGTLEAAALTLDEAILLAEDQVPLKIVLVMDISHGADVVMARPEFSSLADLKGRRIGVEDTALGAYMLTRALQSARLSRTDIEVVPLVVNEHERAFVEGRVDAVVTFEPTRTRLLSVGAHQIFSSRDIPGEIMDVLVMRRTYVEHHPQQVEGLLTTWFRALAYLHDHPDDAARRMCERVDLSASEFLQSLDSLHSPSREENQRLLGGTPPALVVPARQLIQTMLEANLLQQPIAIEGLL